MEPQIVLCFRRSDAAFLGSVQVSEPGDQNALYRLVYTPNVTAAVTRQVFSWQVEVRRGDQWQLAPIHVLPIFFRKVPSDLSEANGDYLRRAVIKSINQYDASLSQSLPFVSENNQYFNFFYRIAKKNQQQYDEQSNKKSNAKVEANQPLTSESSSEEHNRIHEQAPTTLIAPRYSFQQCPNYADVALGAVLGFAVLACFFLLHVPWPIMAGLAAAGLLCILCVAASKCLFYPRNGLFNLSDGRQTLSADNASSMKNC